MRSHGGVARLQARLVQCLAVLCLCVAARGTWAQGTLTFLQTGGGSPLVSATNSLTLPGNAPALLTFQFGFSTEETSAPGSFADAVTAAIADANAKYLPLVTVDASGSVWAPGGGGTVPLSEAEIVRQAIAYPSTVPVFAFKQAWAVSVLVPQTFQGGPVNFYLDLFDNGNALRSVAWFSELSVTAIPEPGTGALALLGAAGLLWRLRRIQT